MLNSFDNIIFDLGGVLVDWNPKYLYNKIFENDTQKVDWFLNNICTNEWNMEQDAGRTFKEGTALLTNKFPDYREAIEAFYFRWEEMMKGEMNDTVLILNKLNSLSEKKLYALTNWSAETFPIAQKRFTFFQKFEGIVVSGHEYTRKPFPKIYEILIERYKLDPAKSVFIDDNKENIVAAETLGFTGIHFKNAEELRQELTKLTIL